MRKICILAIIFLTASIANSGGDEQKRRLANSLFEKAAERFMDLGQNFDEKGKLLSLRVPEIIEVLVLHVVYGESYLEYFEASERKDPKGFKDYFEAENIKMLFSSSDDLKSLNTAMRLLSYLFLTGDLNFTENIMRTRWNKVIEKLSKLPNLSLAHLFKPANKLDSLESALSILALRSKSLDDLLNKLEVFAREFTKESFFLNAQNTHEVLEKFLIEVTDDNDVLKKFELAQKDAESIGSRPSLVVRKKVQDGTKIKWQESPLTVWQKCRLRLVDDAKNDVKIWRLGDEISKDNELKGLPVCNDGIFLMDKIPTVLVKEEDRKTSQDALEIFLVECTVREQEHKYLGTLRKFHFGSSVYRVREKDNKIFSVDHIEADAIPNNDFSVCMLAVRVKSKNVLSFSFAFNLLKNQKDEDKKDIYDLVFFINIPTHARYNIFDPYKIHVHIGFRRGENKEITVHTVDSFECKLFRPPSMSIRPRVDIESEKRNLAYRYSNRMLGTVCTVSTNPLLIGVPRGATYKGDSRFSQMHRKGKIIFPNKASFEGEFKDGYPVKGVCTYTAPDTYVGEVDNLYQRHGFGTYFVCDSKGKCRFKYEGLFKNNKFEQVNIVVDKTAQQPGKVFPLGKLPGGFGPYDDKTRRGDLDEYEASIRRLAHETKVDCGALMKGEILTTSPYGNLERVRVFVRSSILLQMANKGDLSGTFHIFGVLLFRNKINGRFYDINRSSEEFLPLSEYKYDESRVFQPEVFVLDINKDALLKSLSSQLKTLCSQIDQKKKTTSNALEKYTLIAGTIASYFNGPLTMVSTNESRLDEAQDKIQTVLHKNKSLALYFNDFANYGLFGLPKHRAIVFKFFCDQIPGLRCALVRGHYKKKAHIWNLVETDSPNKRCERCIFDFNTMTFLGYNSQEAQFYVANDSYFSRDIDNIVTVPGIADFTFSEDPTKDASISKLIRENSFSQICRVKQIGTDKGFVLNMVVAIKETKSFIEREHFFSTHYHHPNLMQLHYAFYDADRTHIYFVLPEFDLNGVEFLKMLENTGWNKAEKYREIVIFLTNVMRGLHFRHEHGYVHGDVRLRNVLLKTDSQSRPYRIYLVNLGNIRGGFYNNGTGECFPIKSPNINPMTNGPQELKGDDPFHTTKTDVYYFGKMMEMFIDFMPLESPLRQAIVTCTHEKIAKRTTSKELIVLLERELANQHKYYKDEVMRNKPTVVSWPVTDTDS